MDTDVPHVVKKSRNRRVREGAAATPPAAPTPIDVQVIHTPDKPNLLAKRNRPENPPSSKTAQLEETHPAAAPDEDDVCLVVQLQRVRDEQFAALADQGENVRRAVYEVMRAANDAGENLSRADIRRRAQEKLGGLPLHPHKSIVYTLALEAIAELDEEARKAEQSKTKIPKKRGRKPATPSDEPSMAPPVAEQEKIVPASPVEKVKRPYNRKTVSETARPIVPEQSTNSTPTELLLRLESPIPAVPSVNAIDSIMIRMNQQSQRISALEAELVSRNSERAAIRQQLRSLVADLTAVVDRI